MEEILQGLPGPMQLNATVVLITVIFLVLIFILNRFVFKPLVAILDKREKLIEEGTRAREQSLKTVEEKMAAYQAALVDARRNAQARRQNLLKQADKIREETLASAKEKAMSMVHSAAAEIEQQVAAAKTSLEQDTKVIAKKIVNAVLSREPA